MICESLDYYNFRNIETAHIDLCPGINVLYGENAEGKTNAIEGIYLFAGGRSFRAEEFGSAIPTEREKALSNLPFCRTGGAAVRKTAVRSRGCPSSSAAFTPCCSAPSILR